MHYFKIYSISLFSIIRPTYNKIIYFYNFTVLARTLTNYGKNTAFKINNITLKNEKNYINICFVYND